MTKRIILFTFSGRQANVEQQLDWVQQVLDSDPRVEFHMWDLTRTHTDHHYLTTIDGDRITVNHDYFGSDPWTGWDNVWKWYANRPEYKDALFVKVDDDVVFFDTRRWHAFVDMADTFRGNIVSALTINNGASTALLDELNTERIKLGIPILDIHEHNTFADTAHNWFFDHHAEVLDRHIKPIRSDDWLSVNMIGLSWHLVCAVAQMVKTPSPRWIAGREWPTDFPLGDEGACNMLPRIIIDGITCGHLTFGPQHCTDDQQQVWRQKYREIQETL